MIDLEKDYSDLIKEINNKIKEAAKSMKEANLLAKKAGLHHLVTSYIDEEEYEERNYSQEEFDKLENILCDIDIMPLFKELAGWQTSSIGC